MRVSIVVTHLLGTGHLARAMVLAEAFRQAGHHIDVISGGVPAPHLSRPSIPVHQLPPLRSDGVDFTRLLTEGGVLASQQYLAERSRQLLKLRDSLKPDILITELFPFGRRNLREEFMALLDTQPSGALTLCSIRDILAPPSKPEKADFAAQMISDHYAGVLVHGDEDLTPLSLSWPVQDALKPKLIYTGFVAQDSIPDVERGKTILVSTGGGAVGDVVFDAALGAADILGTSHWHMLVGGPPERCRRFMTQAPANVLVEGLRPDFRTLLSGARASVSLAGYNTALDLLQSGTPAVLVPFDEGNEVEQSIRAEALSTLPGIIVRATPDLTPESLADAVQAAVDAGPRARRETGMSGARRSVELCEELWGQRA